MTSILPQLNPITINESNIIRQLNAVTVSMKLRDNNLYQIASTTLLNLYDNFSAVASLASTPINLSDNEPILKHISDFVNNMKPSQRSSTTSTTSEWFICLTEEEHQHYQLHQHLQTRPFNHHQQQRPRLRSDNIIDQCDRLPHLRRQHSRSIREHLAQRAQRLNIGQVNMDKVPSTSRLHRARAIIWFNGVQHQSGVTSTASFRVAQHQHSTS